MGGHCIGVDPYYLTHKAESIGFHPEMILAGRRINDAMSAFVAQDIIKMMIKRKLQVDDARILVMGFTFKENCPDIRNTKVADLVRELNEYASEVVLYDPRANPAEVIQAYELDITNDLPEGPFDAVILAVPHSEILEFGAERIEGLLCEGGLLYDLKSILPPQAGRVRI